jgi:Bacteriophage P22, NinX
MIEKPLHVQVAEALGWTDCHPDANDLGWWGGTCPAEFDQLGIESNTLVYRYDEEWEATGPLIERYHLTVCPWPDDRTTWIAEWEEGVEAGQGPTPLIAVCHLILALAKAGKLEAA